MGLGGKSSGIEEFMEGFRALTATWVTCLLHSPCVGLESLFPCVPTLYLCSLFPPIGSKTKEGVVQGVASGTRTV